MEKLIITCAVTGAEVTKKDNPAVPYTPEELAESSFRAFSAGASVIHLHVRKPDGTPAHEKALFVETVGLIRKKCDPIIMVTTGGAVGMTADQRTEGLEAGTEMCSLTTGTVNFGKDVFWNDLETVEKIATRIRERGHKPEIEIFDAGMVDNANALIKKGLLTGPVAYQFVLGVPGGLGASARNLTYLADSVPHGSSWTVAGVGRHQFTMAAHAILMGGNVRVGLEDNVYLRKGVLAESNAALVERAVKIAKEFDREIADPAEARRQLGLKART
jgi:3-keto-5-aminohexanoate cleavage enzyme